MKRTYTVMGRWPFPIDMLRRDDATPATPEDENLFVRMSGPTSDPKLGMRPVRITLVMESGEPSRSFPRGRNLPNYMRWQSFDWRVVDAPDAPAVSFDITNIDVPPRVTDGTVHANELRGALMIARKALAGTESAQDAIQVIDRVTGYTDADGVTRYPVAFVALFAGLLSLVEIKYGNLDPEVTKIINAARAVLGRSAIPSREGVDA